MMIKEQNQEENKLPRGFNREYGSYLLMTINYQFLERLSRQLRL